MYTCVNAQDGKILCSWDVLSYQFIEFKSMNALDLGESTSQENAENADFGYFYFCMDLKGQF